MSDFLPPLLPQKGAWQETGNLMTEGLRKYLESVPGQTGANFINSLLMGLPGYLGKKTGILPAAQKAIGYQAPNNKVASTIGDIAGMMVPSNLAAGAISKGGQGIRALAKGLTKGNTLVRPAAGIMSMLANTPKVAAGLGDILAGKLGKAAAGGSKLANLVAEPASRILPGMMAGALPSMAEQGVRSMTSEQSLPDALKQMAISGGVGGLVGGITGGLAKQAPRALSEASKNAASATLMGVPGAKGKFLRQSLPYFGAPRGAGGIEKMGAAEDAVQYGADLVEKLGLKVPGKLDEVAAGLSNAMQQGTKVAEAAIPDTNVISLFDKFAGKGALDNPITVKVLDNLDDTAEGFAALRRGLMDTLKDTRNPNLFPNSKSARQVQGVVMDTLDNMNQIISTAAKEAKVAIPEGFKSWDEARKAYKIIEPLAQGDAYGVFASNAIGGSDTAANLFAQGIAQGGDGSGLAAAAAAGGGKLLKQMLSKAIAGTKSAARPLINIAKEADLGGKIANMAPEIAAVTGNVAGKLANMAAGPEKGEETGTVALNLPEAAPEVTAAQGKETQEKVQASYPNKVEAALSQKWKASGLETQYPGMEKMFIEFIRSKTNGFDPEMAGGILGDTEEYGKSYNKTAKLAKSIEESLPIATKYSKPLAKQLELFAKGDITSKAAYAKLEGTLADYIKESGVPDKEARALISKAIGTGSVEKRRKNVYKLLGQFGINQDALTDMGVSL